MRDAVRRIDASSIRLLAGAVVFAASPPSCRVDLPPCDPVAAREIVFLDSEDATSGDTGLPMYAGQALLHESCGGGAYCHSSAAEGAFRFGVPKGYDFDVGIACVDDVCEDVESRLVREERHLESIRRNAGDLYVAVVEGWMPPGAAGARVVGRMPIARRLEPGRALSESPPLPDLRSAEGRRIFGNWLACGAPAVVASLPPTSTELAGEPCVGTPSTQSRGDCVTHLGVNVPTIEPTFDALYSDVLEPLCGSQCHGGSEPRARLRLRGPEEAYDELVRADRAQVLVVPGRPTRSHLLYHLQDAPLGERMPPGMVRATLPETVLDSIRTWIENGANR